MKDLEPKSIILVYKKHYLVYGIPIINFRDAMNEIEYLMRCGKDFFKTLPKWRKSFHKKDMKSIKTT